MDLSHLSALQHRLSHERDYLAKAKTVREQELRKVWIAQLEKEISAERKFLGLGEETAPEDMSNDDLLAELAA